MECGYAWAAPPLTMADPHRAIREIRDPVHGFVKLTDAELAIINTPTFQRLRDVRQLAVAHLVYPGAVHTRFEHSIGCVHLSDLVLSLLLHNQQKGGRLTFGDALSMDPSATERARGILRLASLLHDLGHPPFSHSGEYLLPKWKDAAVLGEAPKGQEEKRVTHEDMTVYLIRESEIGDLIEKHYRNRGISVEDVIAVAVKPGTVRGVKEAQPLLWVLHEILTWDFGTDRMDYLLRDAHHSGQPTGVFDYRKLLDSLVLIEDTVAGGVIKMGIDGSGRLVAEQMVVARYLMYIALYFHKTKRVYEKHVERYLPHWTMERFGQQTLPVDAKSYSTLTESAVMADVFRVARSPAVPGYRDCRPFIDRSHFRQARELLLADNARDVVVKYRTGESAEEKEAVVERNPDKRRLQAFTQAIVEKFDSDVIVDTADHSATKLFSRGTEVPVSVRGGVKYLGELSEIVRGMPARVWRCRVYAEAEKRELVTKECDKWLNSHPVERILINGNQ